MLRKLVIAAAVAATLAALGTAPALAATPRAPHILLNEEFTSKNVAFALWVHAHSLNGIMQDAPSGIQQWWTQDAQSWASNHDGTVTTVQMSLNGQRGYCATWHSADNGVYLDPCVSGFGNGSQQWWVPCAVNCSNGDWWINADASAHSPNPPHTYRYMTDLGGANDLLATEPPGNGNSAVFSDQCNNC